VQGQFRRVGLWKGIGDGAQRLDEETAAQLQRG